MAACGAIVLVAGCSGDAATTTSWRISAGAGVDTSAWTSVRAIVKRGSCASTDEVYAEDIDVASRMAPAVPQLPQGRYGFAASAFDAARAVLATGCVEIEVPTSSLIETVLRDGTPLPDAGPADAGVPDAGDAGVPDAGDAGVPDAGDAGVPVDAEIDDAGTLTEGADRCGDPATPVLTGTTRGLRVDTTTATTDSLTPRCAGAPADTRGNDRFYAIDVAAGEYWHFDVAVDPLFPAPRLNPILYVVAAAAGGCDEGSANCANSCYFFARSGVEHFAFIAPAAGRYYIGIDDEWPGGGHYQFDAFRPICGNGAVEHGESCDDPGSRTCSATCRRIVGATVMGDFPVEAEFNDNAIEANEVAFVGTSSVEIAGEVGGTEDCVDSDVFQIRVPETNDGISVDALTDSGAACPSSASSLYSLTLRNAAGDAVGGFTTDPNGCPIVLPLRLPMGVYSLWVQAANPVAYRLRVTRNP